MLTQQGQKDNKKYLTFAFIKLYVIWGEKQRGKALVKFLILGVCMWEDNICGELFI